MQTNPQWYILYYYYENKKTPEPVAHAHVITYGHVTSGHVISCHDPVTSLPVAPPHSTTSNATLAVLIYYWPGTNIISICYDLRALRILLCLYM